MVADKSTGEINAFHYGAGVDRNIKGSDVTEDSSGSQGGDNPGDGDDNGFQGGTSGGEATYTNKVPYSITSAGNVYNSTGYLNDNKLTSSGEISYAEGYVHTGFIIADKDSVIRVAECVFDGSSDGRVLAYNNKFELLWSTELTGYKDASAGITYTDTGVMVFRPAQVTTVSLDSMTYVRVSVVGAGENLIVTVNENIDNSTESDETEPPAINYTNVVQYAFDKNGNLYEGKGYINNQRIIVTGAMENRDGYVATGYIEGYADAVIRIKGITFNGTSGCSVCIYNSGYEFIGYIPVNQYSDEINGIVVENSVTIFNPSISNYDYASMKYFRISGKGKGEDLIITYNEEII